PLRAAPAPGADGRRRPETRPRSARDPALARAGPAGDRRGTPLRLRGDHGTSAHVARGAGPARAPARHAGWLRADSGCPAHPRLAALEPPGTDFTIRNPRPVRRVDPEHADAPKIDRPPALAARESA